MPIEPFSLKGLIGRPFPELERLNELTSAGSAMSKLYPAIFETKRLYDAVSGVDLSRIHGFPHAAWLAGGQLEQLRVAALGNDQLRALTAVTDAGAFSRIAGSLGAGLHGSGLSHIYSDVMKQHSFMDESLRAIRGTPFHDAAVRSAELASRLELPGLLGTHRIATDMFADRLAVAGLVGSVLPGQWNEPGLLSAFSSAAAMANAMATSPMMSAEVQRMTSSLAEAGIPGNLGLQAYRGVLNAAGLVLPRWPRVRLLSKEEQAERQERRLRKHSQPPHVGEAKSLVHQYERYLRETIDDLMAREYGNDWPEARLTLCGEDAVSRGDARKLLSAWRRHGGNVLDHADYVHYRLIMIQPDHFDDIFSFGFRVRGRS